MTADLRQLFEEVLILFAALLPIVNPFGGAPVFLAMTSDCTRELRAAIARRVGWNAFALLLASVSIGTYGRRAGPALAALLDADRAKQTTPLLTYIETRFTQATDSRDAYRVPQQYLI